MNNLIDNNLINTMTCDELNLYLSKYFQNKEKPSIYNYSTTLYLSNILLEVLEEEGFYSVITTPFSKEYLTFSCGIEQQKAACYDGAYTFYAEGETIAIAICRAFLKWSIRK